LHLSSISLLSFHILIFSETTGTFHLKIWSSILLIVFDNIVFSFRIKHPINMTLIGQNNFWLAETKQKFSQKTSSHLLMIFQKIPHFRIIWKLIWLLPHEILVSDWLRGYAIGAYHHWCCEFEFRSGRGVQHYVIKFVSDLRQVSGFLRVLRFPPPIKQTATI